MLKISAVYLIGNPEIPIHYTSLSQVEQALLTHAKHFAPECMWKYQSEAMILFQLE